MRTALALTIPALAFALLGPANAAPPAAPGAQATPAAIAPEAALERLKSNEPIEADELVILTKALTDAAAGAPKEARWQAGLCRAAMRTGDWAAAKRHGKQAVKLDPKVAEHHYIYGAAIFSGLGQASMLEKMSSAGDGKDAFLEAVKLDPNHVEARMGLAQFYLNAPGIAGGSLKKAREQGEAMVKIAGGAPLGRLVLGLVAAKDEKWDEMAAEFGKAFDAATTDADRFTALSAHANALLNSKNDPVAARPVVERMLPLAPEGDTQATFLLARVEHLEGDHGAAVALYERVLAERPQSPRSRLMAAECYEALGDTAKALAHYDDFVRRFPDDDRTSGAKKAIKRLNKKKKS